MEGIEDLSQRLTQRDSDELLGLRGDKNDDSVDKTGAAIDFSMNSSSQDMRVFDSTAIVCNEYIIGDDVVCDRLYQSNPVQKKTSPNELRATDNI